LQAWLQAAGVEHGPAFRGITRRNSIRTGALSGEGMRLIAVRRAGLAGIRATRLHLISPHGLRAGFVTSAYRNGVPDEEIMGHSRNRSLAVMRSYVRQFKLSHASPAGKSGCSALSATSRVHTLGPPHGYGACSHGLVVERSPSDRHQRALPHDRQLPVLQSDRPAALLDSHRPEALAKNPAPSAGRSRRTASPAPLPRMLSLASTLPDDTDTRPSMATRFQLPIIVWCTPCLVASCGTVRFPSPLWP